LIHFMRLSVMKGAHADLSSTAWQEIGVKPGFGLSGIRSTQRPSLRIVIRSELRISYYAALINGRVCGFQEGKPHEVCRHH
jgi:hypothetical protein